MLDASPSPVRCDADAASDRVFVAIRARPMNDVEKARNNEVGVKMDPTRREIFVEGERSGFACDAPLWSVDGTNAMDGSGPLSQSEVYESVGKPLVDHAIEGYNSCILAYGQTGSGKTYTMMGGMNAKGEVEPGTEGIIPRLCESLFSQIEEIHRRGEEHRRLEWEVKATFVEIYREKVTDLLAKNTVLLREEVDSSCRFKLVGATEHTVESVADVVKCLKIGNRKRTTATTKMNQRSSRSHAVFTLELVETLHITLDDGSTASAPSKSVSVKLVDLAGSERVNESGAKGERCKEAAFINKSLFTLGHVIDNLVDPKRRGIKPPYRDSVLTRILKDSFGGNSKTTMVATISPSAAYKTQTVNTLQYATRARKIANTPIVLEDPRAVELRCKQEEVDCVKRQLEEAKKIGGEEVNTLFERLRQAEEMIKFNEAEAQRRQEEINAKERDQNAVEASRAVKETQLKELVGELVVREEAIKARGEELAACIQAAEEQETRLATLAAAAAEAQVKAAEEFQARTKAIEELATRKEQAAKEQETRLATLSAAAEAQVKAAEEFQARTKATLIVVAVVTLALIVASFGAWGLSSNTKSPVIDCTANTTADNHREQLYAHLRNMTSKLNNLEENVQSSAEHNFVDLAAIATLKNELIELSKARDLQLADEKISSLEKVLALLSKRMDNVEHKGVDVAAIATLKNELIELSKARDLEHRVRFLSLEKQLGEINERVVHVEALMSIIEWPLGVFFGFKKRF